MRRLGEAVLAQQHASPRSATLGAEVVLYGLTNEGVRSRMAEMMTRTRGEMEAHFLALFTLEELPMSVTSFAVMLRALIPGLMFTRAFAKEISDEAVLEIFEGLA